jgi:hypothetical protein
MHKDGRVVAVHHNSGVRNGKRLDVDCCIVFEIKNGRVTRGAEHFYNLYAWDEFWSGSRAGDLAASSAGTHR